MLSFVIPVYKPNLASFEKCLKFLKAQALRDWEAVVVFDGPCPDGERVVRSMKDNRFGCVEIEHGGAPRARNEGFSKTTGKYVVFWDSDCYIEPGASKMWVEKFDKNPHLGVIYSGYKFADNKYAIESNEWDPWRLRIRNFISTCFPTRRELVCKWDESLKSLQDWDYWLSVCEKAEGLGYDMQKFGLYLRGYAFATDMPSGESISAKGCTPDVWLDRMAAVKKNHGIPDRDVCVAGLSNEMEAIRLAKLIGADYQYIPNDKPHKYKTIVQVGFSLANDKVEQHAAIFQEPQVNKLLFWTSKDILEIWQRTNHENIRAFNKLLEPVKQFVEDKKAQEMMLDAGFKTEIMPLPLSHAGDMPPAPNEMKWAVDVSGDFGLTMGVLERSLPEIKMLVVGAGVHISDVYGLIHLYPDATLTNTMKRALITGRHVISNVQQPYCNYVDHKDTPEKLITAVVEKVRLLNEQGLNEKAAQHYQKALSPERLIEVIKGKEAVAA